MTQTTQGPREGVGAKLVWSGNDKIGTGTQVITASTANQSVVSDLTFGNMSTSKSALWLTAAGPATTVRWTLDADMGFGPIGRYFGLILDGAVGNDFDNGLRNLKALVEAMPNADIADFKPDIVSLKAQPVLMVHKVTDMEPAAISKGYADAYGEIGQFMTKNKLKQSGMPFGVEAISADKRFGFDAGIPIDRADAVSASPVQAAMSYEGKALKATHVGPYDTLHTTFEKVQAYAAAHGYAHNGPSFTVFIDDPTTVAPEKLRTDIFLPLK
jgi:effector-binding domain-containing protein